MEQLIHNQRMQMQNEGNKINSLIDLSLEPNWLKMTSAMLIVLRITVKLKSESLPLIGQKIPKVIEKKLNKSLLDRILT